MRALERGLRDTANRFVFRCDQVAQDKALHQLRKWWRGLTLDTWIPGDCRDVLVARAVGLDPHSKAVNSRLKSLLSDAYSHQVAVATGGMLTNAVPMSKQGRPGSIPHVCGVCADCGASVVPSLEHVL